jgi:pyruvate/2-oxoglutarate dehydrogenase complex dihydrolipoamide acyltransferase (E2) component
MKALLELDVTRARRQLRSYRRMRGENISFFAWVIKCLATAIEENKQVHGIRKGKSRLVVFDEVDVSVVIEKLVQGEKVPLPLVIRKANKKSLAAIQGEINEARARPVDNEQGYILGENRFKRFMKLYVGLPRFLRLAIWRLLLKQPFTVKNMSGTAVITSLGMMGSFKGWAIPSGILPVSVILGSVVKKPWVVEDRVEIREILYLSLALDHDVVDGAPAARFVSRFGELIENAVFITTP